MILLLSSKFPTDHHTCTLQQQQQQHTICYRVLTGGRTFIEQANSTTSKVHTVMVVYETKRISTPLREQGASTG